MTNEDVFFVSHRSRDSAGLVSNYFRVPVDDVLDLFLTMDKGYGYLFWYAAGQLCGITLSNGADVEWHLAETVLSKQFSEAALAT